MFTFNSILSSSLLATLSLVAVACGGAPSSEHSSSSGQAVSAPVSNVDPAFAVCSDDTDCVAVAQAGCCNNGWLAAVSSCAVDSYDSANACTQPQPVICPMYMVNDTRVPLCNGDTKVCELRQPTDIDCGDIHSCTDGYTCIRGEERGECVLDSTASSSDDDAGAGNASTSSVKTHVN